MRASNQHINNLRKTENWIDYLKENSGLPGKRANLELLKIITDLGDENLFLSCLKYDEDLAPTNTPGEFIAMCGVTGLGKLVADGKHEYFSLLKRYASDSRWRVREGVAFGLQIIGENNFDNLTIGIQKWVYGNNYEKRAVVAGLCEPKLLKERNNAQKALEILNEILLSINSISNRKSESFRVLRKGLGYGLSVAIVSDPELGKQIFESLRFSTDKDLRWIINENLKKKRLEKMDKKWVDRMKSTNQN